MSFDDPFDKFFVLVNSTIRKPFIDKEKIKEYKKNNVKLFYEICKKDIFLNCKI